MIICIFVVFCHQVECFNLTRGDIVARSSFRWSKISNFGTNVCLSAGFFVQILCRLWYKLYGNRKKMCVIFGFLDAKMTWIQENWTILVHYKYSRDCNRLVWFSIIRVLFASIKTKVQVSVEWPKFYQLNGFFSPAWPLDLYKNVRAIKNLSFLGPTKTGTRLVSSSLLYYKCTFMLL